MLFELHTSIAKTIERIKPSVYAVAPAYKREFAGTLDMTEEELHKRLFSADKTYPVYLAAAKYIEVDGKRIFQDGSYAYRPDGFFGKYQYHVRFFVNPKTDVIEVYCHYELNPWYDPINHYSGEGWDGQKGADWVRSEIKQIMPDGHSSAPE